MRRSVLAVAVSGALAIGGVGVAEATTGYQLDGIGQYQVGMGGAVVAAPGDPMTAISNPAGLADIKPQVAFSAEVFNPTRSANFGFGEIGSHTNVYAVPSLGFAAPVGGGLVFGGGMYGTSGLGTNYIQSIPPTFQQTLHGNTLIASSNLQQFVFAPALAMKVNKHLSVGAALDIGYESASFQEQFGNSQTLTQSGFNLSSPSAAYGVGLTLGFLYKVNPMVTLGLTYKTPQIYTPLNWQESSEFFPAYFNSKTGQVTGATGRAGEYSAHLNYPQQIAIGLAIRPIPQWLVSIEGQWINWKNTLNQFTIYGPWNGTNSVALPTHWRNEYVFNFGTQYDVTPGFQVRAGYVYGSNPIAKADTAANLLFPAIATNAVTFGATEKLGMGWKLTEAYMHSFSNTIQGGPLLNGLQPYVQAGYVQNTSSTLTENSYGIQIGYDF
ncbi:OmpP1/FadL family transporter [Acidithiobacillus caldus]